MIGELQARDLTHAGNDLVNPFDSLEGGVNTSRPEVVSPLVLHELQVNLDNGERIVDLVGGGVRKTCDGSESLSLA